MRRDRFDQNGHVLPAGVSYLRGRPSPYLCRVSHPDTGERLQRAHKTREEALLWLAEVGMKVDLAPMPSVASPAAGGIRFEVAIRQWFSEWTESRSPAAAGRTTRRDDVEKVLIPHFIGKDVLKIGEKDIEAFVRSQRGSVSYKGEPLAPKTIVNRVSVLRQFFGDLELAGIIRSNPCVLPAKRLQEDARVRRAKEQRGRTIRGKCLTLDEARSLVDAASRYGGPGKKGRPSPWAPGDLLPPVHVLLSTGMRLGELCGLRVSHLERFDALGAELPHWRVRIEGKMTRARNADGSFLLEPFTKGGGDRTIPLNLEARQVVEKWLSEMAARGYSTSADSPLFPIAQSYCGFKSMLRRVAQAAGLPKEKQGVHSTRHTTASMLLLQGRTVGEIQGLLGHAHATTTEVYLHATGTVSPNVVAALPSFAGELKGPLSPPPSAIASHPCSSESQIPTDPGTGWEDTPTAQPAPGNVVQLFGARRARGLGQRYRTSDSRA